MKSKVLAALLFFFMSLPTLAQMVSQPVSFGGWVDGAALGQSFTATATAQITQISVRPENNYTGTLHIYNGNVGSGVSGALGTPLYTQAGINLASSTSGGPMRVMTLTTPVPITAGSSYTFILDGSSRLYWNSSNPYAGGQFIHNYANLTFSSHDLAFEIFTAPLVPVATPSSIPTLGEWGLIFMSGLLAMFGLASVRRRKASR